MELKYILVFCLIYVAMQIITSCLDKLLDFLKAKLVKAIANFIMEEEVDNDN